MCPQKGNKERLAQRFEHGLKAEQVFTRRSQNRQPNVFEDLKEEAETLSLNFKGEIVMSQHVEVAQVPQPQPEATVKMVQPSLKRRHPFFVGPNTPLEEILADDVIKKIFLLSF